MAEVIGTISAVISIIDAIAKTYRQAKNTKDLPEVFVVIDRQIEIVRGILERAKQQYPESGTQDDAAVHKIMNGCKSDIQKLEELFEKILTGPDDDVTTRIRKPLLNFFRDRKAKIEDVWKKIMEYIQLLDAYNGFKGLNAQQALSRPIAQIEEVEDSLPETESNTTINSTGPGANFNTGKGSQQNTQHFGNNYYGSAGSDDRYSIKASSNSSVIHNEVHHHNYARALEHRSKQTLVRSALFLTDPESDRSSVITVKGPRVSGTCEWILKDSKLHAWRTGKDKRLWISGSPGQGKTMIAVYLTECLEKLFLEKGPCSLIYFFCDHQNDRRTSAISILRGLLYQLLAMDPRLGDMFHDDYFGSKELEESTLTSKERLWIIFQKSLQMLSEQRQVICVLDGLDECDGASIQFIVQHFNQLLPSFPAKEGQFPHRVLLINRDMRSLNSWPTIRLDKETVQADVARFLNHRMQDLWDLEGFTQSEYQTVYSTLLDRSEGTFLWVGLAMQELIEKETLLDVLQAVETLPKGLPHIYHRIIRSIAPDRQRTAMSLFRWTLFAKRRLPLAVLAEAIGIKPLPGVGCERVVRDYVTACKGLLIVDNTGKVAEVKLLHQSVYDYLIGDTTDTQQNLTAFHMSAERGHLGLLEDCIALMQNPKVLAWFRRLAAEERNEIKRSLRHRCTAGEPLFLRYAVEHWPEHAEAARYEATELYHTSFFRPHDSPLLLELAYSPHHAHHKDSPLHFACTLGLPCWLEVLLNPGSPTDHASDRHDISAWRSETTKQKHGAEAIHRPALIDCVGKGSGYSPLGLAAIQGPTTSIQLARLLLKHGANASNPNRSSTYDPTALMEAFARKNMPLAALLLEHGASTTSTPGRKHGPLHEAIIRGDTECVEFLLQHGVNANARSAWDQSPLHIASAVGIPDITQLLLDYGAEIESIHDPDGWNTPLHQAASRGHVGVIKVLLKHGASVHGTSNQDESPLHSACHQNHAEVIHLLLSHGADINHLAGNGQTPIVIAIFETHVESTAELLRHGVVVYLYDAAGGTALHWVLMSVGQNRSRLAQGIQIAKLLLNYGVAVDATNLDNQAPIEVARSLGLLEFVKLFEEAGSRHCAEARNGKGAVQIGAMR